MIKETNGVYKYYDKNGKEIVDGCKIKYEDGRIEKIYLTENGLLGTDATNPVWIEKGRALPCEFGIYPLSEGETREVIVVE